MSRKMILAALLLAASPATAAPLLWGKVEVGMTPDQVRALYPPEPGKVEHEKGGIRLKDAITIGKCTPDVYIDFHKGTVREVSTGMPDRGLKTSCVERAYEAMVGKYGAPVSESTEEAQWHKTTISRWIVEGVIINMVRTEGGITSWSVTYRPAAPDSGL
jgi:hypothetical protein